MKFKIKDQIKVPEGLARLANEKGILTEVAHYYDLKFYSEDGFFPIKSYQQHMSKAFKCKKTSVRKILNKLIDLNFVRVDHNGFSVVSVDKMSATFGYNMDIHITKRGKERRGDYMIHTQCKSFFEDSMKDNLMYLDLRSRCKKMKRASKKKANIDLRYKDTDNVSLKKQLNESKLGTFEYKCAEVVANNLVQIVSLNDEAELVYRMQEEQGKGDKIFVNLDHTFSIRKANEITGHKSLRSTFDLLNRLQEYGKIKVEKRHIVICECPTYSEYLSLNLDKSRHRWIKDSKSVIRVLCNKIIFL